MEEGIRSWRASEEGRNDSVFISFTQNRIGFPAWPSIGLGGSLQKKGLANSASEIIAPPPYIGLDIQG